METSRENNSTIIDTPLHIGAEDLLKGVQYTYCGGLHLFGVHLFGHKWKHRYCIISQGCLYIYADMTSKKAKHAYSLNDFDSAQVAEPQEGKRFCIQLFLKNPITPLLFACDTGKRREEWLEHIGSAIAHVHTQTYNLSADSGFGSAETVPKHIGRPERVEDGYDSVDEGLIDDINQDQDTATKDSPKYSGKSNTLAGDTPYENAQTYSKESKRKQIHVKTGGKGIQVSSGIETDTDMTKVKELKEPSHVVAETTQRMPHVVMDELKSRLDDNHASTTYENTPIQAASGSSFLSVRGGAMSKVSKDTIKLSDRKHEDLYVNRDSDDSYPEIVYENTAFQKKNTSAPK